LTYDADNDLLTAANYNGNYTFTYDALDRMATQKDMWGTTLTLTYDAVSNRTKVQDSMGGTLTSVYDAVNNLTSRIFSDSTHTPIEADFTYTARNQLATITRLNNSLTVGSTTLTYDDAGRVTHLEHYGVATRFANLTYVYDSANRLTSEVINGTTT